MSKIFGSNKLFHPSMYKILLFSICAASMIHASKDLSETSGTKVPLSATILANECTALATSLFNAAIEEHPNFAVLPNEFKTLVEQNVVEIVQNGCSEHMQSCTAEDFRKIRTSVSTKVRIDTDDISSESCLVGFAAMVTVGSP